MAKVLLKVVDVLKFLQTPRGKRDLGIAASAVAGVVSVLKQFGVV